MSLFRSTVFGICASLVTCVFRFWCWVSHLIEDIEECSLLTVIQLTNLLIAGRPSRLMLWYRVANASSTRPHSIWYNLTADTSKAFHQYQLLLQPQSLPIMSWKLVALFDGQTVAEITGNCLDATQVACVLTVAEDKRFKVPVCKG